MDAMEHGNSGDECEGRPGEERRFDERLPDAFPIARTRSRGRLEERGGGTRGGQSMKVLIHQSSCTALLGPSRTLRVLALGETGR